MDSIEKALLIYAVILFIVFKKTIHKGALVATLFFVITPLFIKGFLAYLMDGFGMTHTYEYFLNETIENYTIVQAIIIDVFLLAIIGIIKDLNKNIKKIKAETKQSTSTKEKNKSETKNNEKPVQIIKKEIIKDECDNLDAFLTYINELNDLIEEGFPNINKWLEELKVVLLTYKRRLKRVLDNEGNIYLIDKEQIIEISNIIETYSKDLNNLEYKSEINDIEKELKGFIDEVNEYSMSVRYFKEKYFESEEKEEIKEDPVNYDIFSDEYLSDDRDLGYKFEVLDMIDSDDMDDLF